MPTIGRLLVDRVTRCPLIWSVHYTPQGDLAPETRRPDAPAGALGRRYSALCCSKLVPRPASVHRLCDGASGPRPACARAHRLLPREAGYLVPAPLRGIDRHRGNPTRGMSRRGSFTAGLVRPILSDFFHLWRATAANTPCNLLRLEIRALPDLRNAGRSVLVQSQRARSPNPRSFCGDRSFPGINITFRPWPQTFNGPKRTSQQPLVEDMQVVGPGLNPYMAV